MSNAPSFACPCCGYVVLSDTYEICAVCAWEYDPVQSEQPDSTIGSNRVTLREAQRNFAKFGAIERDYLDMVRAPTPEDRRDPNWRPLDLEQRRQT